eukprot:Clim_evm19s142 gene=Clim_evmTU19s142
MAPTKNDADAENELLDYEEDGEDVQAGTGSSDVKKGTYVGIQSSGFRDFMLKPELLRAIADCAFEHPSEVQQECIPQAMLGVDILCEAKSGMGKTAVFVLTTLHQMEPQEGKASVLVLCHTRELAFQIKKEYDRFSKYLPEVKTAVFYGGVSVKNDEKVLETDHPHIVVGTPGRIKDLIQRGKLKVATIKHFILDECDKMLETLDMRKDVQEIFIQTPKDKQVMMYTATLSKDIIPVCRKFMSNPFEFTFKDESAKTLHGIAQFQVQLEEANKTSKLLALLDDIDFNQVIIFVKSVPRARELDRLLRNSCFPSICAYGRGMKQEERIAVYNKFKNFEKRVMVATELFGRGVDFEKVNVVINYDMATDDDTYHHRVYRAGRFGTKGVAISFLSSPEDKEMMEKVIKRFEVSVPELPETIDSSLYK